MVIYIKNNCAQCKTQTLNSQIISLIVVNIYNIYKDGANNMISVSIKRKKNKNKILIN